MGLRYMPTPVSGTQKKDYQTRPRKSSKIGEEFAPPTGRFESRAKQISRRPALPGNENGTPDDRRSIGARSSGAEGQARNENVFDGLIGAAVFGAGAVAGQSVQVLRRSVAFISGQAILR